MATIADAQAALAAYVEAVNAKVSELGAALAAANQAADLGPLVDTINQAQAALQAAT